MIMNNRGVLAALVAAAGATGFFASPFGRSQAPAPAPYRPKKKRVYKKPKAYQPVVHYNHRDKRQELLNKMTNWQRNQCGRACDGAFFKMDIKKMKKFISLPHWKAAT